MNKRKGMSLIVLVITILVMIILAGVVVVGLADNNPIESAREATFKSDVGNFRSQLGLELASKFAKDPTLRKEDVNESTLEGIKEYIPSFSDKYEGKLEIVDGELVYIGNDRNEIDWVGDIEIGLGEQNTKPTPENNKPIESSSKINKFPSSVAGKLGDDIYIQLFNYMHGTDRVLYKPDNTYTKYEVEDPNIYETKILKIGDKYLQVGSFSSSDSSVGVPLVGECSVFLRTSSDIKFNTFIKTVTINEDFREFPYSAILNSKGEIVAAGDYRKTNGSAYNGLFLKFDSDLNIIAKKIIPEFDSIIAIEETKDGKYVAAGHKGTVGVAALLDENGNILKVYRKNGAKVFSHGVYLNDGGYAFYQPKSTGYTSNLIKLDSNFNLEKDIVINVNMPLGDGYRSRKIAKDSRDNIYVFGESNVDDGIGLKGGTNAKIIKFNKDLEIKWITGMDSTTAAGEREAFTNVISMESGFMKMIYVGDYKSTGSYQFEYELNLSLIDVRI